MFPNRRSRTRRRDDRGLTGDARGCASWSLRLRCLCTPSSRFRAIAGGDHERVRAMYARYSEGVSLDIVGREFGVSAVRVSQLFRDEGLPARRGTSPETKARRDAERLERVRE